GFLSPSATGTLPRLNQETLASNAAWLRTHWSARAAGLAPTATARKKRAGEIDLGALCIDSSGAREAVTRSALRRVRSKVSSARQRSMQPINGCFCGSIENTGEPAGAAAGALPIATRARADPARSIHQAHPVRIGDDRADGIHAELL